MLPLGRISDYSINLFLAVLWGFEVCGRFSGRDFFFFVLGRYFYVRLVTILLPVIWRIRCCFEFCSLPQRLFMGFFNTMILSVRRGIRILPLWPPQILLRKICLLAFSPLAKLLFSLKQKICNILLLAHGFCQVVVCPAREEQWAGNPTGRGRKWALAARNSQPPYLSKVEKKYQTKNLGCVQLGVNVWMPMHSQEEGGMISSVEEYVETKCSSFLILTEGEGAWKTEEGFSIFFLFTKMYPKSLSKNILVVKMS